MLYVGWNNILVIEARCPLSSALSGPRGIHSAGSFFSRGPNPPDSASGIRVNNI